MSELRKGQRVLYSAVGNETIATFLKKLPGPSGKLSIIEIGGTTAIVDTMYLRAVD